MSRRVVVTGMSAMTPLGSNIEEIWHELIQGKCAITPIDSLDNSHLKVKLAGEIKPDVFERCCSFFKSKRLDRHTLLTINSVKQALDMANYDRPEDYGLIVGTGFGSALKLEDTYKNKYLNKVSPPPATITTCMGNNAASFAAIEFGFKRYNSTIFTACSSGANAIGNAFNLIKNGYENRMVAVGVDAPICESSLESWSSLRAISRAKNIEEGCVPFSSNRNGFILSEGVGSIILEEYESAVERKATILAEVCAYSSNCDAEHITRPNTASQACAIKSALKEAQIEPHDIDYVSAHGTATVANDLSETEALKSALGRHARKVPISALKSQLGHSIGASAALETVFSIGMMNNNIILPTIHLKKPDEKCDLDYVPNIARKVNTIEYVLKNSFGFGGNNAVLILKKAA